MVIIPLTRQVCKGASPEPEPLSAQRAISCKYVSVSIGALAWGFYALTACLTTSFLCGALALRNFVLLFLFKGCGFALHYVRMMVQAQRTMRSQNGLLSCKTCKRTCRKVTLMHNLHEWCCCCRNRLGACRNKHGVNFVAQLTYVRGYQFQ